MKVAFQLIPLLFILSGALCAYLARGKRRSAFMWFWVGLLLGPVGVIVLYCLGDAGVPCPYCRKSVAIDAVKCPYCRSDLGGAG